jgi:hypothetical protein
MEFPKGIGPNTVCPLNNSISNDYRELTLLR